MLDVAGSPTRCGNPTWDATHGRATITAPSVQCLLGAGGLLLGKTRTDELAYSLDGCNFHEGAPLNPAAPDRFTGGSSSGAASAVAAGAVDFAVASDTAGSIRVPAGSCGLIGIRPTHARISVLGLTPLAPSFDTVGWLARSASLMCRIGDVLLERRAQPAAELMLVRDRTIESRARALSTAAIDRTAAHCAATVGALASLSLDLDLECAALCLRILQGHEVWKTHCEWVESARPRFDTAVAERFAAASKVGAAQVRQARKVRAAIAARLDEVLPPGRILFLPTIPRPPPLRDASAKQLQQHRAELFPLTALASLTGRPQVTLPLLVADGAPMGFSLLGWRHSDEVLLQIARAVLPS